MCVDEGVGLYAVIAAAGEVVVIDIGLVIGLADVGRTDEATEAGVVRGVGAVAVLVVAPSVEGRGGRVTGMAPLEAAGCEEDA